MFLKHPLFWKEWKIAKWWSGIMASMFLVMFLAISNSLSQRQEIALGRDGVMMTYSYGAGQGGPVIEPIFLRIFSRSFTTATMFLLPVLIIMSIIFFQSDRKENVGMFISSLPFTKREQFKVKWFTGVLAFTIPFLLATLLVVLMRQVNIGWITQWYSEVGYGDMLAYDGVWMVLSILAQSYLFVVAFFSVLMLMQSLIAHNIAGSIIGSIIVAAPWFILEAGGATLSRIFNNCRLRLYGIEWGNLYFYAEPSRNINIEVIKVGQDEFYINPLISMDHYTIKIAILILIGVVASYIATKAYEKNDNSRNGYLLMFPWVGKILVPGVILCSGLLGNNVINTFFRIESVFIEIITLVLGAFIGYLVITKMIGLTEKHGA